MRNSRRSSQIKVRGGILLIFVIGASLTLLASSSTPLAAAVPSITLSHPLDSLPLPPSLSMKRDLLGTLIGSSKPQPLPQQPPSAAPAPASAPTTSSSGSGGGSSSSPSHTDPNLDPAPVPDHTASHTPSPPSSPPASGTSSSGGNLLGGLLGSTPAMGSSGPSSPDDENNGLDPSSTASQSTTTTKTKPRPTSSSISSSSGYSNEQDNSITGSGSDNGSNSPNSDTNGRSGKTNNNDQNGNAEGLTPGLIALLVMLALAITAAILLSCYKIRQARNRSIKRRVRGASITSGMNLVGPSSGRASSVAREADMESQFNSWRGSDLSKSTFSSPHLQHLRQHSHPYVSHSAPATPPMAAAHIASNVARGSPRGSLGSGGHGGARFSPDRGSLGGGRDDPWRRV